MTAWQLFETEFCYKSGHQLIIKTSAIWQRVFLYKTFGWSINGLEVTAFCLNFLILSELKPGDTWWADISKREKIQRSLALQNLS